MDPPFFTCMYYGWHVGQSKAVSTFLIAKKLMGKSCGRPGPHAHGSVQIQCIYTELVQFLVQPSAEFLTTSKYKLGSWIERERVSETC